MACADVEKSALPAAPSRSDRPLPQTREDLPPPRQARQLHPPAGSMKREFLEIRNPRAQCRGRRRRPGRSTHPPQHPRSCRWLPADRHRAPPQATSGWRLRAGLPNSAAIFRNERHSTRHNPVTSCEVYQAYADYTDIEALTEALITEAAQQARASTADRVSGTPMRT